LWQAYGEEVGTVWLFSRLQWLARMSKCQIISVGKVPQV